MSRHWFYKNVNGKLTKVCREEKPDGWFTYNEIKNGVDLVGPAKVFGLSAVDKIEADRYTPENHKPTTGGLMDDLFKLGYTLSRKHSKRSPAQYAHDVFKGDKVVFTGDAHEVSNWLRETKQIQFNRVVPAVTK